MPIETITIEVQSETEGRKRSKSIEVAQFDEITSAIEFFTVTDEDGSIIRDGEEYAVQLINSQLKQIERSKARASLRPRAPFNKLFDQAKENPEIRSRLNAFLSELSLPLLET